MEFNALCTVSAAQTGRAADLYRFFRSIGVKHIRYIPQAEFHSGGQPKEYAIAPEQYGSFLCGTLEQWWPDRRHMRIRFFDDLAEPAVGLRPGSCRAVVEHNGDAAASSSRRSESLGT